MSQLTAARWDQYLAGRFGPGTLGEIRDMRLDDLQSRGARRRLSHGSHEWARHDLKSVTTQAYAGHGLSQPYV